MILTAVASRGFLEISNLGLHNLCKSTFLNFSSFRSPTTNLCGDPGAAHWAAVWLFSGIWKQVSFKNKK